MSGTAGFVGVIMHSERLKKKLPPGASQSILVLGSKNVFHVDIKKKKMDVAPIFTEQVKLVRTL